MNPLFWLGCDPGASGGIGIISPSGPSAVKMPETEKDLFDLLSDLQFASEGRIFAVCESVHSMPGQGVSSSFKFGMGFGALRMALVASSISHEYVTPQKWQKTLGCLTGGNKNVSKAACQRLFPAVKVTHAIADALLIAEYGRRTHSAPSFCTGNTP